MSERALTTIRDLVVANRILGNEGVVDAFGHISIRHPENPERYFLACSRSPGLVNEDDIVEFDLDSNRLDGTNRAIYAERFIHGCVYKARPDVMSVCHSHAHAVVPFTVTNTPIEPIWVMASGSGAGVPNWDIRDEFPNEGTMLVVNDATGRSLAKTLGAGRVCLLRGHGAVIATSELKATVMVSIGLMCNAAMLIQAHTLSQGRGDAAVKHLSPAEIESTNKILLGPLGLDRAWEYWRVRAGFPARDESR
jgi:ribulose-5-phosphate 4-epimerase/fuculose-1-phosphate aldolase